MNKENSVLKSVDEIILLCRLRPKDGYSQWPKYVAVFRHLRIYVVLMDSLLMLLWFKNTMGRIAFKNINKLYIKFIILAPNLNCFFLFPLYIYIYIYIYILQSVQGHSAIVLTVTINGMQEIHPVIYLIFLSSVTVDWCLAPHVWGFYITHNDSPQSVGLLWTSDQLVAETSTWQHTTLTTDRHPCPWWNSNPWSQQASGRITNYALERAATGTDMNWMVLWVHSVVQDRLNC